MDYVTHTTMSFLFYLFQMDPLPWFLERTNDVIKSVRGRATATFIDSGKSKFAGLDETVAAQRLAELNAAASLSALSPLASVGLHKLSGNLRGFWSINVNGPWRILFHFRDGNAYEVHIFDPH